MWLDGRPYWTGLQMDEAAFPILLVDCLRRDCPSVLGDLKRWWTMVHRAAGFLVRNGPVTQQDRWEEDAGYSPFTLAVEISGLLAAADLADAVGEKAIARLLARDCGCLERQHRALDLCHRTRTWRGRSEWKATTCALRRRRRTARRLAAAGICAHQEPASGTKLGAGDCT